MKNLNQFRMKKLHLMVAPALLVTSFTSQGQSDDEKESKGLEVIQVTAQRRVENLQEVAVSVTAISPVELEKRNVSDIFQMTLAAPSLQTGTDNTFSVRGAGTIAFSSTLNSSVAIAYDEVNLGKRFLFGAVFNDIEQIEVLSGPQGLLFGKNASAGLLNIRSVQPNTDYTEGTISSEYQLRDTTPGDGASWITKGVFNLPLTDDAALRFNVHYATEDPVARINTKVENGQRVDETTDDWGIKIKYLSQLTDDLSLYVIGDINRETGIAGNFDRTYRVVADGSEKWPVLEEEGTNPGPENLSYGNDADNYRSVNMGGLQAKLSFNISSSLELSNIAAWRYYELSQNFDTDSHSANELNLNTNNTDYSQFSNELRLAYSSDEITGQVGLYYFRSSIDQDYLFGGDGLLPSFLLPSFPFCVEAEVVQGGPPNCSYSNDYFLGKEGVSNMDSVSTAIFSQFDFALSDDLKLIAGLRYTKDDLEIDISNGQRYNYFAGFGAPVVKSQSDSTDNVSGKLGLQYRFSRNNMTYLTYSRGYKGPGYNDSPTSTDDDVLIRPEIVDNYELGAKTNWLDNRLTVNGALFSQRFKDYQVEAFDAGLSQFIIQNAAELSSEGLELSISALPIDSLTINASATFLDATFESFAGASCYPGQQDCDVNGTFDASGFHSPTAAKFTSTMSATYEFNAFDDAYGFLTVNYYHRDPVNFIVSSPSETRVGNVDQYGINLGLVFDNGLNVTLFCKNCTDEKVPGFIGLDAGDSISGMATAVQSWGFNSVRNIGIRVAYQF